MTRSPLTAALLVFAVMGLAATSARALEPGCNPEILEIQKNQAAAVQLRDASKAQQLITPPPSALKLTCFDQALRLTSRLGMIFSDDVPAVTPPANTTLLTAPEYPDQGATDALAKSLDNTLSPTFNQQTGSGGNALSETVKTGVDPAIAAIAAAKEAQAANEKAIADTLKKINDILASLSTLGPDQKQQALTELDKQRAELDRLTANSELLQVQKMTPALNALKAAIMGQSTNMDCNNLEALWKSSNPATTSGGAYTSLPDFLDKTAAAVTDTGAGPENNTPESKIVDAAQKDLTKLNAPGGIKSWPEVPVLPPGISTADIINAM